MQKVLSMDSGQYRELVTAFAAVDDVEMDLASDNTGGCDAEDLAARAVACREASIHCASVIGEMAESMYASDKVVYGVFQAAAEYFLTRADEFNAEAAEYEAEAQQEGELA